MTTEIKYGYSRSLGQTSVPDAVRRITDALKAEGFGVLTSIDVQDTFKKKLGIDFKPYIILGACNPVLARRALEIEPGVGLLLPCNVTVFQGARGETLVQVIKPEAMLGVVQKPEVGLIAEEADQRLRRALESA